MAFRVTPWMLQLATSLLTPELCLPREGPAGSQARREAGPEPGLPGARSPHVPSSNGQGRRAGLPSQGLRAPAPSCAQQGPGGEGLSDLAPRQSLCCHLPQAWWPQLPSAGRFEPTAAAVGPGEPAMGLSEGPHAGCGGRLWAKCSAVLVVSHDTRQGQVCPGVGGHVCRAQRPWLQTSSRPRGSVDRAHPQPCLSEPACPASPPAVPQRPAQLLQGCGPPRRAAPSSSRA